MKIIDDIKGRTILVAPLDWGLGHAARSVPVIKRLSLNNKIIVACGPGAEKFLRQELPSTIIITIDDWNIHYPKHRINIFTILGWIPVVLRNSINEHRRIKEAIRRHDIDCIISDNRYGLSFRHMECYIITHQVYPKMPRGLSWLEDIGGWMFKKYLTKFRKVLIPDFEDGESLSGKLAADRALPTDRFVRIGILSRFHKSNSTATAPLHDVMVLMSGQENQRTVLENILIAALADCGKKTLFVRGVSPDRPTLPDTSNITFHNILSGNDLLNALNSSSTVICRAGYSTLCDIVALDKKAIIIPTPGQTEQEYLAERLDGKFGFRSISQNATHFATKIRELLDQEPK